MNIPSFRSMIGDTVAALLAITLLVASVPGYPLVRQDLRKVST